MTGSDDSKKDPAEPERREGQAAREPASLSSVLVYAVWFGLITGLGAVGLLGVKKFVLDQVTLITPQIVWISPLTFVVLALPAGLALGALGRLAPRVFDIRVIVLVLAGGGSACGLLIWGKEFNDLSVVILSLGIGVQFGQLARSKRQLFDRIVRRTMPVLAGLPLLAGLVLNVGGYVLERRAVAALPEAAPDAPNVLLIILDTVRSLSTDVGDGGRPTTPNLQRFAAEGIRFDNAMSPSSWTLPSHASMFTGRPVHEVNVSWTEPLDGRWPTLAEYLRDRGYRTGGVAGNFFYCNSEWGLDRGFIHYKDYDLSLGHALLGTFVGLRLVKALEATGLDEEFWFHRVNGRRIAPDVRADLVRWLDQDRDHPYFAFVNFYDAHDPYVAPDEYYARIDAVAQRDSLPVKVIEDGELLDARSEHRRQRLAALRDYEAGIAWLDDQVGALLTDLEARGLLDNTLVIITSDHGEEFGEHGRNWHGKTLYMPSIHVPLMVRLPDGSRSGERVHEPVSLTDLAATVAGVLGEGDDAPFPGSSFLARRDAAVRAPVLSELTLDTRDGSPANLWFRSMVAPDGHYIVSDTGVEELYDFRIDPFEQLDLSARDTTRLVFLRSALETRMPGNDGGG